MQVTGRRDALCSLMSPRLIRAQCLQPRLGPEPKNPNCSSRRPKNVASRRLFVLADSRRPCSETRKKRTALSRDLICDRAWDGNAARGSRSEYRPCRSTRLQATRCPSSKGANNAYGCSTSAHCRVDTSRLRLQLRPQLLMNRRRQKMSSIAHYQQTISHS